jgi:hypothetical protein
MIYRILAELLMIVHMAFILFVVFGGFAVLKWHWMALVHVPIAAWGAIVELKSWVCPLTPWENKFRLLAGQEGYSEGFIEHYLMPVIYPPGLTKDIQTTMGLLVVAINLLIYGYLIYRLVRS